MEDVPGSLPTPTLFGQPGDHSRPSRFWALRGTEAVITSPALGELSVGEDTGFHPRNRDARQHGEMGPPGQGTGSGGTDKSY